MSKIIIGICTFLMLFITPSVQADPVVITGGSLSVVGFLGNPVYSLTGLNFSVSSTGGDHGNTPNCAPCPSGTPTSLNSLLSGSSLGQGTATINGTTFNGVQYIGEFSFSAAPVILPAGLTNVTVTAPFSFSGFITGCEVAISCTNQFFTAELIGQGTLTAVFDLGSTLPNGVTLYSFRSITYEFQPAEIPEPMTILLLTSGLLGVGVRQKLLRRDKHS